ncbi:T9SS type A sorting domain-containing protein [Lacinutrix salivirga]
MKNFTFLFLLLLCNLSFGQFNFDYDFNNTGRRVCLVSASVVESPPQVIINLHDSELNTSENYTIKKRPINGLHADWSTVATNLPAMTSTWTDTNVALGDAFEYQISRNTGTQIARGYVTAAIMYDQTDYKGQMILVIDVTFQNSLMAEITQLKTDLTNEGWFVNELYVPRATTWETEAEIINIKNQITTIYTTAPTNDKPTHLFLLGHIPIARSGLGEIAPDQHIENRGARGADCYYADIDGVFTDAETFNAAGIDPNAINLPNDLKWDQDYIPSELEMAFGRVDFADLSEASNSEEDLLRAYLTKLHNYRVVASGHDMGEKTAFNFGYDNSNDGSYRSLIPISGINNVDQYNGTMPFAQWVNQNGPYQIFTQNVVTPNPNEWDLYGMDATIYSSDQSYWGFWDAPQTTYGYGFIRYLLSHSSKCLGLLWTTSAVNLFHQPGMGETMGWSLKRTMDNNALNNLYEKPEQPYDTEEYWGRTHLQYNGDPTLRLNQVQPASNLQIVDSANGIDISWSASLDSNILGYHVYKSTTQFGIYTKLTTTPTPQLNFNDASGTVADWYIVRAIKLETTGSGTYLNPSIGINGNSLTLTAEAFNTNHAFTVFPNPTENTIWISTTYDIVEKILFDTQGKLIKQQKNSDKQIEVSGLSAGIYFLKIESTQGLSQTVKVVKQ